MHGILNLDKPKGWTSRDAVNVIQRLVRPEKTGHAGTLDPLARGVLVCPVGPATRLIEYVQRLPKTYEAVFLLGRHSETEDVDGTVVSLSDPPIPELDQIEAVLPSFRGLIEQVPPAFSALKVQGKRAYDLARKGQAVELKSRPVIIYSVEIQDYTYPRLGLRIECGSGTYVRSLGRDLARSLGTEAVMAELTRTAIGPFRIEDALAVSKELTSDDLRQNLRPTGEAVEDLPQVTIDRDEIVRLAQGKRIDIELPATTAELAAVDAQGNLVAILGPDQAGRWRTLRNFANLYL